MEKQEQQKNQKSKAVNSGQAQYLRNLDKNIRKKWNQLRFYRKNKVQQKNEESFKTRKLQTEPIEHSPAPYKINPYAVQFFRQNKKREVIRNRNIKNDDIFYRKRSPKEATSKNISHSLSLDKKRYFSERKVKKEQIRKSKESIELPKMLQKRPKKLQKEMDIIANISSKSLNNISIKELHRQQLMQEQKERLLDSLKGSKIYYKFVQKWTMPRYQE